MVERDFHVELYPCRKNYEYLYKQGVERDFNESSSNLHKLKSEVEEEKRLHKKEDILMDFWPILVVL